MSLQFNNSSSGSGIIQTIERTLGFNPGDVSGDPSLLSQFTADVNLAVDRAVHVILQSGGTWHFDDVNHTDYPLMTTDLASGQRDYPFTTDGSGNLVLEVYRVMVADPTGVYHEIYPVDQETPTLKSGNATPTGSFIDGRNASGTPRRYSKTANGIFLDVIPNYAMADGLKVFVSREGYHFVSADTSKMPGFAGLFHEYCALRPSYQYAWRRSLESAKALQSEVEDMERSIQEYYSSRQKDAPQRVWANVEDNR